MNLGMKCQVFDNLFFNELGSFIFYFFENVGQFEFIKLVKKNFVINGVLGVFLMIV